jgi:hypothetical protein
MNDTLAINGGPRAVPPKLPTFLDPAGRTFGVEEERLVIEALRSGCLSRNGGAMVERLEQDFAAALGVPHVVACSSGTAAVHLALAALDLAPGDEVIVPPVTDIGSSGRMPCRFSPTSIRSRCACRPTTWPRRSRRARARSSPSTSPDSRATCTRCARCADGTGLH